MYEITIVGAGLAGTETAFQLAKFAKAYDLNIRMKLYEMRPKVKTPAHHTENFAELVCSNSLGSEFLTTARGVLIQEMKLFDSLIINSALKSKVPAGQALAVDRDKFAEIISETISVNPYIEIIREEFINIPADFLEANSEYNKNKFLIIASGPLTSPNLSQEVQKLTQGKDFLNFFDAASPILTAESINMDIAFKASRYGKGETDDYINCPFYSADEYYRFQEALLSAERAELQDFEKENMRYFEGCMPVEAIAERGKDTLRFGPLKPVGLTDPRRPNEKPYAVVQLRQDNVLGSLYNIVGFQTNLKWGEQKRVFSMIPSLENLDIVRYGVMHQNIFLNSPTLLSENLSLKTHPNIYFAGQITGVEGYTESAGTGIVVARSIVSRILSEIKRSQETPLSRLTMLGALVNYVTSADPKRFQPINSNWALINPNPDKLEKRLRKDKRLKNEFLAERALALIREDAFTKTAAMIDA
ncbi:MAG: methylenetetrahydrofolate--tRNA-(uracil(54)-C(5))-methyltransferase (FADH(2)-oxidizing) TrmFO [Cyanobacteria bacterium REEB446]|nr:methylenetetrahydrofolate--tRNA-(uracil(54)-C(5))-methyltransferase (FADH(2)-oxidizing) TrmFO [Cyanobacteria bacterium REEB446]